MLRCPRGSQMWYTAIVLIVSWVSSVSTMQLADAMEKAGASPSVCEVIIQQKGEWKTIGIFSLLNEVYWMKFIVCQWHPF